MPDCGYLYARDVRPGATGSPNLSTETVLRPSLAELKHSPKLESLGAITLEEAERDHIRKTLEYTKWVVAGPTAAAARLGVKRSTVYFRMQKLGISRSNTIHVPTQQELDDAVIDLPLD